MNRTVLAIALTTASLAVSHIACAMDIKSAVVKSIDQGELIVEIDDATGKIWQERTGVKTPVMAKVTPIYTFRQEGCKRVNVVLYQDGVPTKDGAPARFAYPFQMSLCRSGLPPSETIPDEVRDQVNELAGKAILGNATLSATRQR